MSLTLFFINRVNCLYLFVHILLTGKASICRWLEFSNLYNVRIPVIFALNLEWQQYNLPKISEQCVINYYDGHWCSLQLISIKLSAWEMNFTNISRIHVGFSTSNCQMSEWRYNKTQLNFFFGTVQLVCKNTRIRLSKTLSFSCFSPSYYTNQHCITALHSSKQICS